MKTPEHLRKPVISRRAFVKGGIGAGAALAVGALGAREAMARPLGADPFPTAGTTTQIPVETAPSMPQPTPETSSPMPTPEVTKEHQEIIRGHGIEVQIITDPSLGRKIAINREEPAFNSTEDELLLQVLNNHARALKMKPQDLETILQAGDDATYQMWGYNKVSSSDGREIFQQQKITVSPRNTKIRFVNMNGGTFDIPFINKDGKRVSNPYISVISGDGYAYFGHEDNSLEIYVKVPRGSLTTPQYLNGWMDNALWYLDKEKVQLGDKSGLTLQNMNNPDSKDFVYRKKSGCANANVDDINCYASAFRVV